MREPQLLQEDPGANNLLSVTSSGHYVQRFSFLSPHTRTHTRTNEHKNIYTRALCTRRGPDAHCAQETRRRPLVRSSPGPVPQRPRGLRAATPRRERAYIYIKTPSDLNNFPVSYVRIYTYMCILYSSPLKRKIFTRVFRVIHYVLGGTVAAVEKRVKYVRPSPRKGYIKTRTTAVASCAYRENGRTVPSLFRPQLCGPRMRERLAYA